MARCDAWRPCGLSKIALWTDELEASREFHERRIGDAAEPWRELLDLDGETIELAAQ